MSVLHVLNDLSLWTSLVDGRLMQSITSFRARSHDGMDSCLPSLQCCAPSRHMLYIACTSKHVHPN